MKEYGLGSISYELVIDMQKALTVKESPENSVIFETIREHMKVVEEIHLTNVRKWLEVASRVEDKVRCTFS